MKRASTGGVCQDRVKRRSVAVVRLNGSWGSVGDSKTGGLHGIQVLLWPLVEKGAATQGVGGPFFFFSFLFLKKSWLPQTK